MDDIHLLAESAEEAARIKGIRDTLLNTIQSSPFFITDRLSIGLGPPTTEVGDEIWIVCGRNLPLVLRRENILKTSEVDVREIEGRHRLVGPCYVDGIMDGDAAQNLERDAVKVHLV